MVSSPQVWAGEEGRFPRASVLPRRQVRLPAPPAPTTGLAPPLCQMTAILRIPENRPGGRLDPDHPFSRRGN